METRNKIIIGLVTLGVIIMGILIVTSPSFAAPVENDVKLEENSELIYYIDVNYDGKDANATTSSDSATASVYSDYIYVEDKIPDGLTFKGFVTTDDGSIGAVKRSDGTSCAGYVENGTNGLTYNELTRTVSFRVKNLQAGCKVTVGIITETPTLPTGTNRMDFYNTAYGREGSTTFNSNTVHSFIGRDNVATYQVIYEYVGTVPEGAPEPPITTSYIEGSSVGVSQDVTVEGYTFSGWTSDDVTVTNGSFTMPANTVTFKGSFTESVEDKYTVSYNIKGDTPSGYAVPLDKEYEVGDDVQLDSLKPGDEINGYRFLGWTSTDVTLPETEEDDTAIFTMPEHDVVITGSFERISYTVTYLFQGSVIPPNSDSLLPETVSYYPGDKVTLAEYPVAEGHRFLGWYYADTFTMPSEDVVIYGEWMIETGTFSPTITKTITNKQDIYQEGEKVSFDITVTNTADFTITDVILEEKTDGSYFISGDDYILRNNTYVLIPSITAGNSVTVHAEYIAGNDVVKNITNTVELTGALADNNYYLDTTKDYIGEVDFTVANISLNINKINEDNENLTDAEFTLYSNEELTDIISTGLSFNGLSPNTTYYLKETKVPTGYQILKDPLEVNVDNNGTITIDGYDITTNNGENEVSIVNYAINVLPNTGGIGIIPYIVIGLSLVMTGTICLIIIVRKKGGNHEKDNI